jgi:hypothetical protein
MASSIFSSITDVTIVLGPPVEANVAGTYTLGGFVFQKMCTSGTTASDLSCQIQPMPNVSDSLGTQTGEEQCNVCEETQCKVCEETTRETFAHQLFDSLGNLARGG